MALSMHEAMTALGPRISGLGQFGRLGQFTATMGPSDSGACWSSFAPQSKQVIAHINEAFTKAANELASIKQNAVAVESRARVMLLGTRDPKVQGVYNRAVEAKRMVGDALNDVEAIYNRAVVYAKGASQSGQCPFVKPHPEADQYLNWISEAEKKVRNARGSADSESLLLELDQIQNAIDTAAREAAEEKAAAEAAASSNVAAQAALQQAQIAAQQQQYQAELDAAAAAAAAAAEARAAELAAQERRYEREDTRAEAIRQAELTRQQWQMEMEAQRQAWEEERAQREEERASRQEQLMVALKLLEKGVVTPGQLDVSEVTGGMVQPAAATGYDPYYGAQGAAAGPGVPALPPGYMYAEVPDTYASAYPSAYPSAVPSYSPYPSYAPPAPAPALGPVQQQSAPPPVQTVQQPAASMSPFPGFEFSSAFTPGNELFGMGSMGGVPGEVAAGYHIIGPTATGAFKVTAPDGRIFDMGASQVYTQGGGAVRDPKTGVIFYTPPGGNTAVDIAGGFKAFADALLPTAAGAFNLYQQVSGKGLTQAQILALQQQEAARRQSGYVMLGLGALALGGLFLLTSSKKEH